MHTNIVISGGGVPWRQRLIFTHVHVSSVIKGYCAVLWVHIYIHVINLNGWRIMWNPRSPCRSTTECSSDLVSSFHLALCY